MISCLVLFSVVFAGLNSSKSQRYDARLLNELTYDSREIIESVLLLPSYASAASLGLLSS